MELDTTVPAFQISTTKEIIENEKWRQRNQNNYCPYNKSGNGNSRNIYFILSP